MLRVEHLGLVCFEGEGLLIRTAFFTELSATELRPAGATWLFELRIHRRFYDDITEWARADEERRRCDAFENWRCLIGSARDERCESFAVVTADQPLVSSSS